MYQVYIITNRKNTVLYAGVTSKLEERIRQHGTKRDKKSFSARYNLDKLVYCEEFYRIEDAIVREKQIKAGSRADKVRLIESVNPPWRDLLRE